MKKFVLEKGKYVEITTVEELKTYMEKGFSILTVDDEDLTGLTEEEVTEKYADKTLLTEGEDNLTSILLQMQLEKTKLEKELVQKKLDGFGKSKPGDGETPPGYDGHNIEMDTRFMEDDIDARKIYALFTSKNLRDEYLPQEFFNPDIDGIIDMAKFFSCVFKTEETAKEKFNSYFKNHEVMKDYLGQGTNVFALPPALMSTLFITARKMSVVAHLTRRLQIKHKTRVPSFGANTMGFVVGETAERDDYPSQHEPAHNDLEIHRASCLFGMNNTAAWQAPMDMVSFYISAAVESFGQFLDELVLYGKDSLDTGLPIFPGVHYHPNTRRVQLSTGDKIDGISPAWFRQMFMNIHDIYTKGAYFFGGKNTRAILATLAESGGKIIDRSFFNENDKPKLCGYEYFEVFNELDPATANVPVLSFFNPKNIMIGYNWAKDKTMPSQIIVNPYSKFPQGETEYLLTTYVGAVAPYEDNKVVHSLWNGIN